MLHRTHWTRNLGLLASMALIWLLTGLACVATDARHDCGAAVVTNASCQQEQADSPGLDVASDHHHLCARVAESISLTSESGQLRSGGRLTRAQQRTEGGRLTISALRATPHSIFTRHQPRHFALASSGVAFISSRACDYYVFALRRILD